MLSSNACVSRSSSCDSEPKFVQSFKSKGADWFHALMSSWIGAEVDDGMDWSDAAGTLLPRSKFVAVKALAKGLGVSHYCHHPR